MHSFFLRFSCLFLGAISRADSFSLGAGPPSSFATFVQIVRAQRRKRRKGASGCTAVSGAADSSDEEDAAAGGSPPPAEVAASRKRVLASREDVTDVDAWEGWQYVIHVEPDWAKEQGFQLWAFREDPEKVGLSKWCGVELFADAETCGVGAGGERRFASKAPLPKSRTTRVLGRSGAEEWAGRSFVLVDVTHQTVRFVGRQGPPVPFVCISDEGACVKKAYDRLAG